MKVTLNCITNPLVPRNALVKEQYNISGAQYLAPEEYLIYCARVSSPDNRYNHETAPGLLKYLITHKHWSPFEMVSIGFEIETSRAIAQQILRHRSFSFQEFSQRYAAVADGWEDIELRKQADKNRQSSAEVITDGELHARVDALLDDAFALYEQMVNGGVAKEVARMVLPLATRTTMIMHGTLRSWIHFLEQRCDEHAQKEVRLIANEIRRQLTIITPWTATAMGWKNA